MLFNSLEFMVFLPVVLTIWFFSKGVLLRQFILVISSFIFYSWGNPWHLFLLLLSGTIDYQIGKRLHLKKSLSLLLTSIFLNIGILAFFKFGHALTDSMSSDFLLLGIPIGVSFYTFQSMSYSLDIYRGKLKPADNLIHFFSFLAFFPQLVAGPICRGEELLGQMKNLSAKQVNYEEAFRFLAIGFFQKMFLADYLGKSVDNAYNSSFFIESGITWWLIHFCFGYQIYMDFFGYTNIARGLAGLLGITLPENFKFPYFANSLTNFWRSWHITLSSWFRDYVYYPLGGDKKGISLSYLFIFITFLLSGIWHGSTFNFVIWGVFCGLMIIGERILLKLYRKKEFLFFGHFLVIFTITISWVFFRSPDLHFSFKVLERMLSLNGLSRFHLNRADQFMLFFLLLSVSFDFFHFKINQKKGTIKELILLNCIIPITVFFRLGEKMFVYFRF
ncbi:MAG: MBOAT family protein [Bacteriovoracaceae bacterium]|nr:MBOAT family protein [Bacteriovoracaceae bacterium]